MERSVRKKMRCWHCHTILDWKSDYDIEHESEGYAMETFLICPNCDTEVLVYLPKEKEKDDDSESTVRSSE